MTFFDAFAAANPALHGQGDLAARLQDILRRHAAGLGESVDTVARWIERGVERSVPVEKIKSSLSAMLRALKRKGAKPIAEEELFGELAELFARIERHGEGKQIESYSNFLFTVETDLRF